MSPTGSSTNQIINVQENVICIEDDQIAEIEDHVKVLSYNLSFLSSNQDSVESIATPQEADFEDEQIRALLTPTAVPTGARSAERSQVYHSERGKLGTCSIVSTSE